MTAWLADGAEITRRSFAIVEAEADLSRFGDGERRVATRIIHACGMVEIADDLCFAPGAVDAGIDALKRGAPILADANMVAWGITRSRLPADNPILCMLDEPTVPERAREAGITRSAAAVDLWENNVGGAVVAIGNAPTSLFRLLDHLAAGWPRPAAILGFPVGFVGAAESKLALEESDLPFGHLTGTARRQRDGGRCGQPRLRGRGYDRRSLAFCPRYWRGRIGRSVARRDEPVERRLGGYRRQAPLGHAQRRCGSRADRLAVAHVGAG